jgi:hypothetical protein
VKLMKLSSPKHVLYKDEAQPIFEIRNIGDLILEDQEFWIHVWSPTCPIHGHVAIFFRLAHKSPKFQSDGIKGRALFTVRDDVFHYLSMV